MSRRPGADGTFFRKETIMKTHHVVWILAGVTFTGLLATSAATAQTVVSPAGSENIEGDRVFNDTFPLANGGRVQELHLAADFAAIEGGGFQIIRMAYRPDHSVTAPLAAEFPSFDINLSTTPRGGLVNTFDDNHGDDVMTVFSGDVPLETDGCGPAAGPCAFDYVFDFDTPFPYDPAKGNLLVEFVLEPNAGSTFHDAHRSAPDRTRIVLSFSPDAEFAERSGKAVSVTQFTVEPVPRHFLRGDCNDDGDVNIADATCALNWLFAGGPMPGCLAALNTNGDGAVDIADPVYLLGFLFGGGSAPAAPFPDCGPGMLPADKVLGCVNPPDC